MWHTLALPWQTCVEEAWAAYCAGSIPIGAAITDANGQIIACGRNRIFELTAEDGYLCGTRLAHAEVNALLKLDADKKRVGLHDLLDRRALPAVHRRNSYGAGQPCALRLDRPAGRQRGAG
jgi:tRNA(Arg) A34 adenosine deaminase TadA